MSTTDQILGPNIDHFTPEPLPLTKLYADHLNKRLAELEMDISWLDEREALLQDDLTACRATRATLADTRARYRRDLGSQYQPSAEQPVWPVKAGERGHTAEKCPKCGDPMFMTAKYGNVHETAGDQGLLWVAAGEWCQQQGEVSES
ncbi:hypothetical protein FXF51_05725 [Nonomuraea sp. PA05]|uniref:hypothetical protein n=1 Tax=Nonomuraea sp. PA05 TaxID=2604466 RepID=UPI0011D49F46|nr:hypothetical protein [Nonomuraea sp. PA05]TYB69659.1 hypothetical protein FXF51_05725 [Nonomuraea sp. PA05]